MKETGNLEHRVRKSIEASIEAKRRLLSSAELVAAVGRASEILGDALHQGNKVLLFGNGGSAADAQHIAGECLGRFVFERPALPAVGLFVDGYCVTCIR